MSLVGIAIIPLGGRKPLGRQQKSGSAALIATVFAHALLRIAGSASAVLIGLYLAQLSEHGSPLRPRLSGQHPAGQDMAGAGLAGNLGATAFLAELIFSLPLGFLSDAVSPRWLIASGAVLGAGASLLFGAASHTTTLFLSRILEGIGVAAVTPPLLAYLASSTATSSVLRARVMSLFEVSLLAGLALGGLVAGQFWLHFELRAFNLLGSIYLAAALLFWVTVRAPRGQGQIAAIRGLRQAWASSSVRRLAPVWLCVNSVVGLWLGPALPFLLTHRAGTPQYLDGLFAREPARVGWLLLGYAIVFAIGVSGWSVILPRIKLSSAMLISLLAMLPVCAAIFALNHSQLFNPGLRWGIGIVTALLIFVESGFTPAALAWLAQCSGSAAGKGSTMGIYSVLLSVGAIAGSLLAGALGRMLSVDGLLLGTVLMGAVALFFLARLRADPAAFERVQM